MVLMDHLKCVAAQSTHNGVSAGKLSTIFGPLLYCTAHPRLSVPPGVAASVAAAGLPPPPSDMERSKNSLNFLDHKLAGDVLDFLLNIWPGRTSRSFHNSRRRDSSRVYISGLRVYRRGSTVDLQQNYHRSTVDPKTWD